MSNRLFIIGGRPGSGKSTAGQLLSELTEGSWRDSSGAMLGAVRSYLWTHHGLLYDSYHTMVESRWHHRGKWADAIAKECSKCPTAVADKIYSEHTIYVGPRKYREYSAIIAKYNPVSIWIDRDGCCPEESMDLTVGDFDHVVDNNGSIGELTEGLRAIVSLDRELDSE